VQSCLHAYQSKSKILRLLLTMMRRQ